MAKAAAKGAAKSAAKAAAKPAARKDDREAFAARPETTGKVKVAAPQTGADYLASLSDGREVFIYGERVKDVTKHQAFRNTARMVARLYDALHDPKRKDKILLPTETGNGGMTHAFFKAPKTLEEMIAGRNAIAEWAKLTYGWMGRAPDYKAAFLTLDRRRISRLAARRSRDLHLRRARQGRHHASGLPQHRAHGRAALRRAARPQAQGQAAACRPTPATAA